MIRNLARSLREYKWPALISPVCMVGEVYMEVQIPRVLAKIVDYGVEMGDMGAVLRYGGILVVLAIISLMFGVVSAIGASYAATGFARNLRHDMFHKVQGQTENVPRKPSPIVALTIAEEFGVRPGECLYMGDTDTDMETGHGAGMFTIGVTWGFRPRKELEDHKADLIVDRPEEILEFVKKDKNPGKS